ncbi:ISL3 family transposase [Lysinibacillus phage vB_LspM-01]|nr:ISL3 family transposase [Lysinibacillus phage vB_LspM-01]
MSLLQLPSFKEIAPMQENETDMLFKVEVVDPPFFCPHCGTMPDLLAKTTPFYKHGKKEQLIMDMPIRMKRVGILVHRYRYKCRDCNTTFWEWLLDADEKRKMTNRLMNFIQQQSMQRTFLDVAELTGVTEGTVRNVFRDYVEKKEQEHEFITPKWLGIDEIYVIKKPRLILTNIEERTVYDLVDNRKQENVIKRLEAIPDRQNIECVTMDMWYPYRRSVHKCMPNAEVIVDKFHVVRMGNNALENVRKKVRLNASSAERKALMHDRKILLKRNHDLDERGLFLMEVWLDKFPDLRTAYDLKERFYGIWDCPTKSEAIDTYREWLEDLQQAPMLVQNAFSDIPTAFENWGNEILNYFDLGLTNAYTESLNSIIRKIDQSGRGYSFDVLRAKLLFNEKLHKTRTKRFNREVFHHMYYHDFNRERTVEVEEILNYGVDFSTLLAYLEQED